MLVGWAVKSKHDLMIGKLLATSYFVNQWRNSDQRSGDTVDVAMKVAPIWLTGTAFRWGSRLFRTGAWAVSANPVTAIVTYSYIAGAVTSDIIDPEEGLDNYLGFTSGGIGGNSPNYVTGDANDSGYFNVVRNMSTIFESNRSKISAAVQRQAEQAYIDAYWEAKAVANFEAMIITYNALTPAQQQEIRAYWSSRLPGRYLR